MKKILFFLPVLLLAILACNDKGKGSNPPDNISNNRDKDNNDPDDKDRDDEDTRDEDLSDSQSGMTGKWRIADIKLESGDEPSEEEMEDITSSTIEFKRDGSYIAISKEGGDTKKEYGTYTYDARAKTLETVEEKDGKRENFEVEFKGKNKVMLTFSEGMVTMERD